MLVIIPHVGSRTQVTGNPSNDPPLQNRQEGVIGGVFSEVGDSVCSVPEFTTVVIAFLYCSIKWDSICPSQST